MLVALFTSVEIQGFAAKMLFVVFFSKKKYNPALSQVSVSQGVSYNSKVAHAAAAAISNRLRRLRLRCATGVFGDIRDSRVTGSVDGR